MSAGFIPAKRIDDIQAVIPLRGKPINALKHCSDLMTTHIGSLVHCFTSQLLYCHKPTDVYSELIPIKQRKEATK